jgi:hypothetical protein
MYYNPPIAEDELKKEQKNKLDKKAKESSEHQSKIIKFTRPGKFTSAELYKTLEENKDSFGDKLEEIYAELSGFFSSNPKKTTVSVAKVKNILNVTNNPQDECEQFIAILKLHLAEKLKPEKIREELDKRMIENSEEQRDLLEEKKQKSLSEESKKSPFTRQLTGEELETDYLRMAIGRNLSDEVEVILKNNPEIFNSERYKIHTALLDALNNNSTEIFRLVLNVITPAQKENLINIRGRDQGNTILIEACLNQEMDITEEIGELINTKGINFDLENKKGETALEIAVQRSFSDNRFVNIAAQIILAKRKVQTHMELGQEENYGQDINEEVERLESLELEELLKLKLNDDPSTSITGVNRGKSRSETKTRG